MRHPYARSELKDRWRSYGSPRERLLEAIIAIADADSEDDGAAYHAGWVRLRKALLEQGWTPPPSSPSAPLDADDAAA